MNDLLKRIHGVMRVLLIVTAVLAYPIFQSPPDVLDSGRQIVDGLGYMKDCWYTAEDFMKKDEALGRYVRGLRSPGTPTSVAERLQLIGEIRVQSVTWLKSYLSARELFNLSEACQRPSYEGPDLKSLIQLFKSSIPELARLHASSGLPETATFEDLHLALGQKVVVPVLGQTLDIGPAIKVIGTGVAIVLLYLYTLTVALRATAKRVREPIYDWLFLHPGPLGMVLGVVWIIAPALLMAYSLIMDLVGIGFGASLCAVLFILAIMDIRSALELRRANIQNLSLTEISDKSNNPIESDR